MTPDPKAPAPFVTFYSFKGGVGRTMALANTGAQLASRGFRVLMIDFDLEAPGLSYLQRQETPGLVDLLLDARLRGVEADLFALTPAEVVGRYTRALELPPKMRNEAGTLHLMPAGLLGASYSADLDRLALGQLYKDGDGQPLMAAFKEIVQAAEAFDFVLVDSRTGFSDESGICTRDLADAVVAIVGLNRQNREGTATFLAALRKAGRRPLAVAMSPVPNGEEEAVERAEADAVALFTAAWEEPVEVAVRIPYHPALALNEDMRFWPKGPLSDAYGRLFDEVLELLQLTPAKLVPQVIEAAKANDLPRTITAVRTLGRIAPGALEGVATSEAVRALLAREDSGALHDVLLAFLPASSWVVGHVAVSLHNSGVGAAGRWYERAILARPADATLLGNFAAFLRYRRADHDAAESFYRRALDANPQDANHLGELATFLSYIRHDHDAAEALFRRAIEVDPSQAINLGNYANFLTDIRHDHDTAEGFYRRAIEADPRYALHLGNYANFLSKVRQESDAAEAIYRRAIEADPGHATTFGRFADFMWVVRQDADAAEDLYRRGIEADPRNPALLGLFAIFLTDVRAECDAAEGLYRRAIDADPRDANHHGNFAQFLLYRRRTLEALPLLERAWAADPRDALHCELLFYAWAHQLAQPPDALPRLLALLRGGARSVGWNLDETIKVAIEDQHPTPDLLRTVAQVLTGAADVSTLDGIDPSPALEEG